MALLFPWATKEYLLHNMSYGQIVMYYNLGVEQKYGKQEQKKSLKEMTYEQLKTLKDELKAQYGNIEPSGEEDA